MTFFIYRKIIFVENKKKSKVQFIYMYDKGNVEKNI